MLGLHQFRTELVDFSLINDRLGLEYDLTALITALINDLTYIYYDRLGLEYDLSYIYILLCVVARIKL